jgi:hypothetical protein
MGRYLDMLQRRDVEEGRAISDKSEISHIGACSDEAERNQQSTFLRLNRLLRTFQELERRCPDYVDRTSWQAAVEDGRRFLARWGERAEALGWTARDLFGLFLVPEYPHPTFSRLSRYEHTGLIWLLHGCPVIALTEATAAIQNPSGAITIYRKHNKPVLGPAGDSLDDLE